MSSLTCFKIKQFNILNTEDVSFVPKLWMGSETKLQQTEKNERTATSGNLIATLCCNIKAPQDAVRIASDTNMVFVPKN